MIANRTLEITKITLTTMQATIIIHKCSVTRANMLRHEAPSMNRRARKAFMKEIEQTDNIISSQVVDSNFKFNYLRFNSSTSEKKFDTSKRYHHIGGATQKYHTNIQWTNNGNSSEKKNIYYKKGKLVIAPSGKLNPQKPCNPENRGPSLPSNPLPILIFKSHNDAPKAEKFENDDLDDFCDENDPRFATVPQFFQYLKPKFIEPEIRKFIYDDFLTDEQNIELINDFRKKIKLPTTDYHSQMLSVKTNDHYLANMDDPTIFTPPTAANDLPFVTQPTIPLPTATQIASRMLTNKFLVERRQALSVPEPTYIPPSTHLFSTKIEENVNQYIRDHPITIEPEYDDPLPIREPTFMEKVTSYTQLPSKLNNVINKAHDIVENVVPPLLTQANQLTQSAQSILTNVTDFIEQIKSGLNFLPSAAQIADLTGHLVNLLHDTINHNLYSLPMLIFKVGFSFTSILRALIPNLRTAPYATLYKSQAYHNTTPTAESIFSLFTANSILVSVGRSFNSFAQIKNGIKSLKDFVNWIFQYLPTFMQDIIHYFYPDPKIFNERYSLFIHYLMDRSKDLENRKQLPTSSVKYMTDELTYFDHFLLIPDEANKTMVFSYAKFRILVTKLIAYHDNYLDFATPRQCPFSMVFHGESRVGKSVLIDHTLRILQDVVRHEGPVSYVRQPGATYWDGYNPKTFGIVFDDWLQNTDYEDVTDMFSLITKQHFIVPMASLDDPIVGTKGTLCLAKIVVAATNIFNKDIVSTKINSPDALFSRIALRIETVKVKDKYDESGDFNHLQFYTLNPKALNDRTSKAMTYHQLLELVVTSYKRHYETQATIDKMIDTTETVVTTLRNLYTQPPLTHTLKSSYITQAGSLNNDLEFRPSVITYASGYYALCGLAGIAGAFTIPTIKNNPGRKYGVMFSSALALLFSAYSMFNAQKSDMMYLYDLNNIDLYCDCLAYIAHLDNHKIRNQITVDMYLYAKRKQPFMTFCHNVLRALVSVETARLNNPDLAHFLTTYYGRIRTFINKIPSDLTLNDFINSRFRQTTKYGIHNNGMMYEQLDSESRTFEEKSRKQNVARTETIPLHPPIIESRTFEEKSARRNIPRTETEPIPESRTFEEKSRKLNIARTENRFGDFQQHSKFTGPNAPFYEQQPRISAAFANFQDVPRQHLIDDLFETQGSHDPAAATVVNEMHKKMIPLALTYTDSSAFYVGTVNIASYVNTMHIESSRYLVPKHFFYGSDGLLIKNTPTKTYRLVFTVNGIHHPFDFEPSRITPLLNTSGLPTLDAVLYDTSRTSLPLTRGNLSRFIHEKDLSIVKAGDTGVMIGNTLVAGHPMAFTKSFTLTPLLQSMTYEHAPSCSFVIYKGFTYEAATSAGDCGSPIVLHKSGLNEKLIGIHLFGHKLRLEGGAMFITQEMLQRVLPAQNAILVEHNVSFKTTPLSDEYAYSSQGLAIEIHGQIEQPVFVNRSTNYTPTPLLGDFQRISKHPSNKKFSEGFDPLYSSAALFGSEINNISDSEYKEPAIRYLLSTYAPATYACTLTAKESVNEHFHMDSLNLHTSAGYPYVLTGKSKRTFFDNDPATGIISYKSVEVERSHQVYIDSWRTTTYEIPWIVSLKDELLKPGKLARVFEIPPLEYTIAVRAYFGSWISMMHGNVGKQFSCVGMNPESKEWTAMYSDLAAISHLGIDADAPNWDKNLEAKLIYWATESVNRWYRLNDPNWKLEDDIARYNLISGLIHAYLLVGDILLRKLKGMPSGHVLTALFNSVVNMIMHIIWYLASVPVKYRDVSLYDRYVRTKIYGDDSLDAIAAELLPYLNRNSMIDAYRKYCSMTITSSQKDGVILPYEPLMNLTFLKRGFRADGVLIKPLLSLTSLYSMICYIKEAKHVSLEDQLQINMRVFLSFAYFYGPEYYNKLSLYFSTIYPTILYPSYAYFDNMFLYGEYDAKQLYT
jgi:hypothetical protein